MALLEIYDVNIKEDCSPALGVLLVRGTKELEFRRESAQKTTLGGVRGLLSFRRNPSEDALLSSTVLQSGCRE